MRDTWGLPARRGRGHTAVLREMRNHLPNTTQKEPVGQPLRGYSRARSRERPGRPGPSTVQEQPLRGGVPPRPWVILMCNTEAFEARTGRYPVRNFCWNSSMGYPSHAPPPKSRPHGCWASHDDEITNVPRPPTLRVVATMESSCILGDAGESRGICASTRLSRP